MLVYALDKIHKLLVIKLSYRYVKVCGDGKTVELLYKIKSDYGVKMEWLHMLGNWHLIKRLFTCISKKVPKYYCKITSFKDDDLGQCRFYYRVQGVVEKSQLCYMDAKRHN